MSVMRSTKSSSEGGGVLLRRATGVVLLFLLDSGTRSRRLAVEAGAGRQPYSVARVGRCRGPYAESRAAVSWDSPPAERAPAGGLPSWFPAGLKRPGLP